MFLRKQYFDTFKFEEGGLIYLGDNNAYKAHNIDSIILKMFDECEFIPHNVTYNPELRQNMLSINMFDNIGYFNRV